MTRSHKWTPLPRTDRILWDDPSFHSALTKDLNIDPKIDPTLHQSILYIIHNNYDSFCGQGPYRPIFDFELCIDTGDSKPLCYRQPAYGICEKK